MPNWVYNRGTLEPFTVNGVEIIKRLLANQNTQNWFGNAAPVEVQILEDSLPVENKDAWLQEHSEYAKGKEAPDFSSEEYDAYLEEKYGFVSSYTRLTFGVKWGACQIDFSGDEQQVRFRCQTPWGVPEEFYQYLARNGIDMKVDFGGEMDGTCQIIAKAGMISIDYQQST